MSDVSTMNSDVIELPLRNKVAVVTGAGRGIGAPLHRVMPGRAPRLSVPRAQPPRSATPCARSNATAGKD
ncbi:MAG: hypothetical protein R2867_23015 [Caldilineaceae bacterium]